MLSSYFHLGISCQYSMKGAFIIEAQWIYNNPKTCTTKHPWLIRVTQVASDSGRKGIRFTQNTFGTFRGIVVFNYTRGTNVPFRQMPSIQSTFYGIKLRLFTRWSKREIHLNGNRKYRVRWHFSTYGTWKLYKQLPIQLLNSIKSAKNMYFAAKETAQMTCSV